MNPMGFSVLKHAESRTKSDNSLENFFYQKGIDLEQVKRNPEYYEDFIMEYSRNCIDQELYRQSKEKMEEEFNKLCDFHRRNEENLVEKFFIITKSIIKDEMNREEAK